MLHQSTAAQIATPRPDAGCVWYKIYALAPPRRYVGPHGGAKLLADTVVVISDPDRAIAAFQALIARLEQDPNSMAIVHLSQQKTPDANARGKVIYRSNLARKVGRGRVGELDKRLVLPATRAWGELVEKTWPWHPSFLAGVEACVDAGDITRAQADAVLAACAGSAQ